MNKFQNTSLCGRFYVAAELLRIGFSFEETITDTSRSEIVVVNKNGQAFTIRIKSRGTGVNNWVLRSKDENNYGQDIFYVLVTFTEISQPRIYVVPSQLVAKTIYKEHREWADSKNIPYTISDVRKFKLPIDSEYLNCWRQLLS